MLILAIIALTFVFPAHSLADSTDTWALRCGNYSVQVGDSEMYVRKACKDPMVSETEYTTLRGATSVYWYNKGRNDFIYRMSFDDGVLYRIQIMERGH